MASQTHRDAPWPAQTSSAVSSSSSSKQPRRVTKRRRIGNDTPLDQVRPRDGATSKVARQVVADQGVVADALYECQYLSGNNIYSCFPHSDTIIAQHQWATFVWNSRRPEITQTNLVDIFLFRGDSREQILHFSNVTNPTDQAGSITAQVNDSWWGGDGDSWTSGNTSYPFYWVIIRSDTTIDGNAIPQPTFTAVQTTFADSVVASMASSSAASASSASAASASSESLALATRTSPFDPSGSLSAETGSLQSGSGGLSFPHWAIAVIVVLGFLAIAATCILAFLILRRIRRRNTGGLDSNRNSMGSASPMIAAQSPGSPLIAAAVPRGPSSTGHGGPAVTAADRRDGLSMVSPDGASTISRAGSAGDPGPFSEKDAQIMAEAFRKMLRRAPEMEQQLEEEEDQRKAEADMHRELADEGRDIRSVSSSRGVKVEAADTLEGASNQR